LSVKCKKVVIPVLHLHLWLANCYFAHNSLRFPALRPFFNASSRRPFHPPNRRLDPVVPTWRCPLPRCRVPSAQTPAPDRKSLPATIAHSILVGPHPCRLDGALDPSYSSSPCRDCTEAFSPASPSQSHEQAKVPHAVLTESPSEARPERSDRRSHSCGRRNEATQPNWGSPRIAQQIALAFHIQIDKDVVRRILARHYRPGQDSDGPSWLTFLGHMKDSLWSMDLFRCESATLRTHWVLVVMDQYTRRIIGFGVHVGTVDGAACRMFNSAIRGQRWMPNFLSSDNDPLYRLHQWQANLRILEVTEIKSVPYVPLSHPFVERSIGTVRREYLDHILFWTTADLEKQAARFQDLLQQPSDA
jgi:transposase InsO family protein